MYLNGRSRNHRDGSMDRSLSSRVGPIERWIAVIVGVGGQRVAA